MESGKRKAADDDNDNDGSRQHTSQGQGLGLGTSLVKRIKDDSAGMAAALTRSTAGASGSLVQMKTLQRTSGLQAPIMLLTGHQGEVFSCKFSPNGLNIASSSFDRMIYLWNTYGDCSNYRTLKGHTGAVLEVQWSRDGTRIFSASTDKTVSVWDAETGDRIKKFKGHGSFVNAVTSARMGPEVLASVSDDSTLRVWDVRQRTPVHTVRQRFQLTSVAFSHDGSTIFSGGLDNEIKAWDLRKLGDSFQNSDAEDQQHQQQQQPAYKLLGHLDTVTGLRVSPDGSQLLSYAMDNTVRTWDIKPFAAGGSRMLKIFEGAPQGMEKHLLKPCWSADGEMIAAGAADRTVVVWDVASRKIMYKLPGHKGCVTEVDWHPKEPIIVSSSNDRTLFLGEVNPKEVQHAARGL